MEKPMSHRICLALLPAAALALASGCADNPQPTGTPILGDPTATQHQSGASDDVLEVSQYMLNSMRRSPKVAAKQSKVILLDQDGITIDPKLSNVDGRWLYNQFQASLNKYGPEFSFLDRQAVAKERARQLGGEVKTSGVDPATAGADMNLTIELSSQAGAQSSTVMYTFKLTDVKDSLNLWSDSKIILKRS
jgi:PBP1b-binding outer membrane lipoprotein LpoB